MKYGNQIASPKMLLLEGNLFELQIICMVYKDYAVIKNVRKND